MEAQFNMTRPANLYKRKASNRMVPSHLSYASPSSRNRSPEMAQAATQTGMPNTAHLGRVNEDIAMVSNEQFLRDELCSAESYMEPIEDYSEQKISARSPQPVSTKNKKGSNIYQAVSQTLLPRTRNRKTEGKIVKNTAVLL